MFSGEGAVDAFHNQAANVFIERKAIAAIAVPLLKALYPVAVRTKPYESDTIAAVAAHMYAEGRLSALAAQMTDRQFSETDLSIISSASQALLRTPNFSHELFDGDAEPLIRDAIEKARERFA